jgi:hypothetical protein
MPVVSALVKLFDYFPFGDERLDNPRTGNGAGKEQKTSLK